MADTTNVLLFIMFFSTSEPEPPAGSKQNRVYTLQATQSLTFNSIEACERVGRTLIASMKTTDTLESRAWCFVDEEKAAPATTLPDIRTFRREGDKKPGGDRELYAPPPNQGRR
jgi:hypothetical protein